MKIKEITLQTGLTDKAIRLYIENGLVSPVIEEAYNGRKKIDFSQADADRLKNIAILRKAGFSINDIKEIISGGEAAEDTVKSFIEEAKKQIEHQSETVTTLENADFGQGITLESLCAVLMSSAAEKAVPKEDMNPSIGERIVRQAFSIIGIVGTVISLIPVGWFIWNWLSYKHLQFNSEMIVWAFVSNMWWLALALVWLYLYRGNTENRFFRKKTKNAIKTNVVLSAVCAVAIPGVFLWFAFTALVFDGEIYCETDKPEHYLDFSDNANWLYREAIEIFPSEIPEYAETVKYYYRLNGDYYDVFAEWTIPEYTVSGDEMKEIMEALRGKEYGDALLAEIEAENWYEVKNWEYEKAKARVLEKTLSIRTFTDYDIDYDTGEFLDSELKYEINRINPVNKGDWVCYFFEGDRFVGKWDDDSDVVHSYLIFAYNNKTQTLRYILSKHTNPYLAEIEW